MIHSTPEAAACVARLGVGGCRVYPDPVEVGAGVPIPVVVALTAVMLAANATVVVLAMLVGQ